ncbi:18829_t:CDS:2 [Dentiscutata erythropus]|uniref:18829_t:CDS:1 n=1 Tax=Dentiscutata erythropus TaxID=1348616 RepID=A0A9N9IBC8_9GLOM|nr:18829_t:CDS:2 [Dentiscutata erythropus]
MYYNLLISETFIVPGVQKNLRQCNFKHTTSSTNTVNIEHFSLSNENFEKPSYKITASSIFDILKLSDLRLWSERREMYDGEWRVEALGDVVFKYKHKPKPNITVKINEPEQVMIYKSTKNSEKVTGVPSLLIQTATPRESTSD